MAYYTHCPNCGARGENTIFRCRDCGTIYCKSCAEKWRERGDDFLIFFKKDDTIHYLCPDCNSENWTRIGEVEW
jgi:predicted RNA-binding Zn-ribbon protein involved in translation (DUF1610 family)